MNRDNKLLRHNKYSLLCVLCFILSSTLTLMPFLLIYFSNSSVLMLFYFACIVLNTFTFFYRFDNERDMSEFKLRILHNKSVQHFVFFFHFLGYLFFENLFFRKRAFHFFLRGRRKKEMCIQVYASSSMYQI